ncbi:hypothetical protein ISN45_Aa07g025280 [Arabidopsis thaliana x Arabidopsis arenosa]|uniref:C-JID domain-containing protein n=1 Tax=Arabidopsis thaliana x Arabidopsis arenosa TaxID=1240361 RepID=A0A8T1Y8L2_9BRAS|nr:hypothetical protein ISN45_Aa07g025280 [Arabidopsis thaliana x Arabidopsis arenosa]
MDMSEWGNLREIPDLSKATNLVNLYLSNCKSLVTVPSTIGTLQKLRTLGMQGCTGLEVLPVDVNLSSLRILDLSGCSRLRSFPLVSRSIEWLYLENTAIEEVPCCIEKFSRLTILMMYCCKSNNGRSLFLYIPLYESIEYTRYRFWEHLAGYHYDDDNLASKEGFIFQNCCKLNGDARELILRSWFKPVALPGGEVPTYFQHRANGDSLTVTLPQSSLSQKFLRFKACIVVDHLVKGKSWGPYLEVNVGYNGTLYCKSFFKDAEQQLCKTDHLFFCSFKFQPEDLPSKLTFNNVEFNFSCSKRIKECGVRLLNVSPYPDDSDGSSETEYNQQFGEKCDVVVENGRSKKRMLMTLGTSQVSTYHVAKL